MMPEKTSITATVEQLREAFTAVTFRDPAEWHWQKFIQALRTIVKDTNGEVR